MRISRLIGLWSLGVINSPTVQATSLTVTNITDTTLTISLTPGNGGQRLMLTKFNAAVDSLPVDNTTYTAGAFGAGSELGTGNFVTGKGNFTSLTITALSADSTYHNRACEINGAATSNPKYLTSTATGNPLAATSTFLARYQDVIDYALI